MLSAVLSAVLSGFVRDGGGGGGGGGCGSFIRCLH